jgi:hypothetical protein
MAAALDRGDQPRCWFIQHGHRVEFNVLREEFKAKHPQSEWWVTVVTLLP